MGGIADIFGKLSDEGTLGQRKPHQDNATLYVSGLPPDTTELDLFKIFSVFGGLVLKGVRPMQNSDGSCTGIAFVDYFQEEAAQAAIDGLHGFQLPDGFTLHVNIKHSKPKSKFTPQVVAQMQEEMATTGMATMPPGGMPGGMPGGGMPGGGMMPPGSMPPGAMPPGSMPPCSM